MKRKIKFTDEPLGDIEVINDFLPPPDQLVLKDDGVKVTMSLSKRSVDFFKAEAGRSKTSYQRMIRRLLDTYAEHYAMRSLTIGWRGPAKDKVPRNATKSRGRST